MTSTQAPRGSGQEPSTKARREQIEKILEHRLLGYPQPLVDALLSLFLTTHQQWMEEVIDKYERFDHLPADINSYAAGYDVRVITLPEFDIRTYTPPENVYGILAAPPCTHFSVSGAQYWKAKDADGQTFEDITILTACLMIIAQVKPVFWVIENPVGRMRKLLGKPVLIFDPCDFGDPYTKKTLLWGQFNTPEKSKVTPIRSNGQGSWLQALGGKSERTKRLRSMTPQGFAKAFMEANK